MRRYEMRLTFSRVQVQQAPPGWQLRARRTLRSWVGLGVLGGVLGALGTAAVMMTALRVVWVVVAVMVALTIGLVLGPGPEPTTTLGTQHEELERLAEVAETADGESLAAVAGVLEAGVARKLETLRGMLALAEADGG